MFCPQCGTETREPRKFCKQCGTNLRRVQGILSKGGATDWDRAIIEDWQRERDREKKKSPEEKRLNEIKGGVITSCVGLGLMIFLGFLFNAIANSLGDDPASHILRAIPLVGVIPFLVGVGIIINGIFVSKRLVRLKQEQEQPYRQPSLFSAPDTSPVQRLAEPLQSPIADFSVAEQTTTRLREPAPVSSPRDTN
jgi:hypothetical protein